MKYQFLGVTWDTEDLISCEQAVAELYFNEGVSVKELYELNFAGIDIDEVIDELS